MIDTTLRDMILAALEQRSTWQDTKARLMNRGHNEQEINDVLDDLFKRRLIEAHELPDVLDEDKTWYEPVQLTVLGYQFIEKNKLDLTKLFALLPPLLGVGG